MAKKAHFFSHDMNARHDPKISAMRGQYGADGYGWFWMLIEMMAESDGYQLDCKSKYTITAYAMQLQCKPDVLQKFIEDCITEFELFETDGMYLWSNSLRKRMTYRDAVAEKRSEAANKRWNKPQEDANVMQLHSKSNANAMQNDANETKRNETKLKDKKKEYAESVLLTESEYSKLIEKYGSEETLKKWLDFLSNKILANGYKHYKSHYRVMLGWVYENFEKSKQTGTTYKKPNAPSPTHRPTDEVNEEDQRALLERMQQAYEARP